MEILIRIDLQELVAQTVIPSGFVGTNNYTENAKVVHQKRHSGV
jgi:hypothetical protein